MLDVTWPIVEVAVLILLCIIIIYVLCIIHLVVPEGAVFSPSTICISIDRQNYRRSSYFPYIAANYSYLGRLLAKIFVLKMLGACCYWVVRSSFMALIDGVAKAYMALNRS